MTLPAPELDDRSFEEILDEALARIPVHNPEYTNFNESDPGVTVLEVFSFLAESILYRANQVPERNRVKFLRLLGLSRRPASVAQGIVTFSNPRGALEARVVDPETEVRAGSVPFRTVHGLSVLPIESRAYYKQQARFDTEREENEARRIYDELFASFTEEEAPDRELSYYRTTPLPTPRPGAPLPSVDLAEDTPPGEQSLWLALLARTPDEVAAARETIAGEELSLAVVPALSEAERVLYPEGEPDQRLSGELAFELTVPSSSDEPAFRRLEADARHQVLAEPGVVALSLPEKGALEPWTPREPLEPGVGPRPPLVEDPEVEERLITWIRIRPQTEPGAAATSLPARFTMVDVNGARIEQRTGVHGEFLGKGTGGPDQRVQLVNNPVLPDHLELTVGGETWSRIDDLRAAPAEVPRGEASEASGARSRAEGDPRVYEVDRATGAIRFGDGLRGARPPEGAVIQADYQYGGGEEGSVGIGGVARTPNLPGLKVSNPIPTWGAASQESVEEAERRISEYLKRRHRLVSREDFERAALRVPGVEVGRVEVLPLTHPDPELADLRAEGVVTVIVIPSTDSDRPDAPVPDRLFLEAVCDELDGRRLLTTELHVRGPTYVPVAVGVGIETVPGTALPPVREGVRAAVRRFLSPLEGGFREEGWPLGRAVEASELAAVAARVDGVAAVTGVRLRSRDAEGDVTLRTLELPRVAAVAVEAGSAPDPGTIAPPREPDEEGPSFVPVPVVPPEC